MISDVMLLEGREKDSSAHISKLIWFLGIDRDGHIQMI